MSYAGGVALNGVADHRLLRDRVFHDLNNIARLHCFDGQHTGHEIRAQLDGGLDDSQLIRVLTMLRSLRIMELGARP